MFKPVLAFLLFFCLLQSSFARAHVDKDKIDYQKLSSEGGQSIDILPTNSEKSIQHTNKSNEFIFPNKLSVAKDVREDFWKTGTRIHTPICRLELLLMANGSHLYFPINENFEVEKEQKIVAVAVSKLMMNLKTMERTYKMTVNVTEIALKEEFMPKADIVQVNGTTIKQNLENDASAVKHEKKFLAIWFRILDQQLNADTELNTDYRRLKAEAKEYVNIHPSMKKSSINVHLWAKSNVPLPEKQIGELFINNSIVRLGYANRIFFITAGKNLSILSSEIDRKHFLLARALIEKASSNESAVNQIYQGALQQASQLMYNSTKEEVSNKLFTSIEKSSKDHPKLDSEIQFLMKRIEGNYKEYEKFISDPDAAPF